MEKKINQHEIESLEQMFSPHCDFRVSSAFTEKVMMEARSIVERKRRRLIFWITSSAAALAIIMVASLKILWVSDKVVENPVVSSVTSVSSSIKSEEAVTSANPVDKMPLQIAVPVSIEKTNSSPKSQKLATTQLGKNKSTLIIVENEISDSVPDDLNFGAMPIAVLNVSDPVDMMIVWEENQRLANQLYIEEVKLQIQQTEDYISNVKWQINQAESQSDWKMENLNFNY